MLTRSTKTSAPRGALRAAVVASFARAAPVFAQPNDKMAPIATPEQPLALFVALAADDPLTMHGMLKPRA
jgi:hypothetical protein